MAARRQGKKVGRRGCLASGPGQIRPREVADGCGRRQSGRLHGEIGAVTANADGSFSRAIGTLTLNVKAVQISPWEKTVEQDLDLRLVAGQNELGVAQRRPCGTMTRLRRAGRPAFGEPVTPSSGHRRLA